MIDANKDKECERNLKIVTNLEKHYHIPDLFRKENDEEWYCINCGKRYTKWQKLCDRCVSENMIYDPSDIEKIMREKW